jgi:predicted Zn-dependent protease
MSSAQWLGNLRLRLLPIFVGLIAVGILLARGCQRGAFNRLQLVGLTADQEASLGEQTFRQVLTQSDVVQGGQLDAKIREIGQRLARAAEDPEFLKITQLKPQQFAWEFRVVRSNQVNAFCLPGGKVVFYTGIIPVCETEAGAATVMGHEIGHALAHHGAERLGLKQIEAILAQSASLSMGNMSWEQREAVMRAFAAGAQYGVQLPFSRDHESEADHIGILLMAAAGYDPQESAAFWRRMSKSTGGARTPEWQSTHPSHTTRIQQLEEWREQAQPLYERSNRQQGNRPLPRS